VGAQPHLAEGSLSERFAHDIVTDCSTFQICGDRRSLVHLLLLVSAACTHRQSLAVQNGVWWADCMEFWELSLLTSDPTVVRVNNPADIAFVQLNHSTFQLLFGLGSF